MITYPAITTWAIKMTASCSSYSIAVDKGKLQTSKFIPPEVIGSGKSGQQIDFISILDGLNKNDNNKKTINKKCHSHVTNAPKGIGLA